MNFHCWNATEVQGALNDASGNNNSNTEDEVEEIAKDNKEVLDDGICEDDNLCVNLHHIEQAISIARPSITKEDEEHYKSVRDLNS